MASEAKIGKKKLKKNFFECLELCYSTKINKIIMRD
jgi:hypothetical protein